MSKEINVTITLTDEILRNLATKMARYQQLVQEPVGSFELMELEDLFGGYSDILYLIVKAVQE